MAVRDTATAIAEICGQGLNSLQVLPELWGVASSGAASDRSEILGVQQQTLRLSFLNLAAMQKREKTIHAQ